MASTIELAELSEHAYGDSVPLDGWKPIVSYDAQGVATDRRRFAWVIPSGFAATLYRSDAKGEFALVIRGTEPEVGDLANDAVILDGRNPPQLFAAREALRDARSRTGGRGLYLSGHSLGGGLALLLAAENPDLAVVTFNAPVMRGLARSWTDVVPLLRSLPLPVVVWTRRDMERALHVKAVFDPVSVGFAWDRPRNPGRTLAVAMPGDVCRPPQLGDWNFAPVEVARFAFCNHKISSLIRAIRAAPSNAALHHDLRW